MRGVAQPKATIDYLGTNDRGKRNMANVKWVVMHTTENDATSKAINVVKWQESSKTGSYNVVVDNSGTSVRHNDDNYTPWSVGDSRGDYEGLHLSMVARAAFRRDQWLQLHKLIDESARIAAGWCREYGIPPVRLNDADIRANKKGFIDHAACSRLFGKTNHTDPGAYFPWDVFLKAVKRHLDAGTPKPAPAPQPKPQPQEDSALNKLLDIFSKKYNSLVEGSTFKTTLGHFILLIDAATYRTEKKVDQLNDKCDEILNQLKGGK